MKKILMLLLVFMLAFACVACGDEPENPQTPSEPTEPTPEPEPTLYTVKWYDENGELIRKRLAERAVIFARYRYLPGGVIGIGLS